MIRTFIPSLKQNNSKVEITSQLETTKVIRLERKHKKCNLFKVTMHVLPNLNQISTLQDSS